MCNDEWGMCCPHEVQGQLTAHSDSTTPSRRVVAKEKAWLNLRGLSSLQPGPRIPLERIWIEGWRQVMATSVRYLKAGAGICNASLFPTVWELFEALLRPAVLPFFAVSAFSVFYFSSCPSFWQQPTLCHLLRQRCTHMVTWPHGIVRLVVGSLITCVSTGIRSASKAAGRRFLCRLRTWAVQRCGLGDNLVSGGMPLGHF